MLSLFWIAHNPVGFLKAVSLRQGPPPPVIRQKDNPPDVAALIGSIPYNTKKQWRPVYSVFPPELYKKTIVEGNGTCASLVSGMSYHFSESGIDYQVIYVLPKENFLEGRGHMLLRTVYRYKGKESVGVIDVFEAGLPKSGNKHLDIADLGHGAVRDFSLESLTTRKDNRTGFYNSFLNDTVLGYTQARDIERYHGFIERVYRPLGLEKAEQLIYKGLSVLLGYYPPIYVSSIREIYGGKYYFHVLSAISLWIFRLTPFVLLLLLVIIMTSNRSRKDS